MKTKLLAALLVAVAVPFAAHAQNAPQKAYVGASVGHSELKASAGSFSDKESETGYKVVGGYQFNPTFGIEGGYVDLGKVSGNNGGNSASIEPTSTYFAATATVPVAHRIALFAKAGVAENRTKARTSFGPLSSRGTETKTTAILGVGAAYALTSNVSLTVEYENFGKVLDQDGASLKTSLLSVGARYRF